MRKASNRISILALGLFVPISAASAGTLQVEATFPPLHANRIAPTTAVIPALDSDIHDLDGLLRLGTYLWRSG